MAPTMALVINCGSSSLKYGLFDVQANGELSELCVGLVDKIGLEGCVIKHEVGDKAEKISIKLKDHGEAMTKVVEILTKPGGICKSKDQIKVVGHRVVHGGAKFSDPAKIDDKIEAEIKACIPLAPLHNPANLLGITMAREVFKVPHVAVFDTAFHASMPPESYRYALPKELYEKHSVRRYGFHGTSYKYVSAATAGLLNKPLSELNMIICHLGNGCSMACVKGGKCVDTTMGLTPLEGLMMGTRCGDVDAGVYTFLCDHVKMSPKEVDTLMNKKSGLLGVAGKSDMREVIQACEQGDADALLARQLYVERVRKYLGAFLVKLHGDLDALVFTAGIGENDASFRELVTKDLVNLGLEIDPIKNKSPSTHKQEVSTGKGRTRVFVVPTQEELTIAQQSLELCGIVKPGAAKASGAPKKRHHRFTLSTDEEIVTEQGLSPFVLAAGALAIAGLAIWMDRSRR